MQAILPGQPQAQLQALDYGYHEGQLVVAYISGSSVVLLNGPRSVLQTIQTDDSLEHDLVAVEYHQATGRIAAASKSKVYVYGLREEIKGTLRWRLELVIGLQDSQEQVRNLSWGSDEELMVGTTSALVLFSASADQANKHMEVTKPVWTKSLPSPSVFSSFSPSASLIATLTPYDCLVKIWRRLSFESPEFDYAYLRHPDVVTHLEWRKSASDGDPHVSDDDVLFTICADGKFRAWKSTNPHGIEILSLWAEVDMIATIQPRDPTQAARSQRRYAFVIAAHTVDQIAQEEPADDTEAKGRTRHAREYFKEVTSRQPDIVIITDEHGHMSAWGLESVGCKRRASGPQVHANLFHINHVEALNLGIMTGATPMHFNTRMLSLLPPSSPGQIAVLSQHFDGRISWHQGYLRDVLDPSSRKERLTLRNEWTGHLSPIRKIIRTASGRAVFSSTDNNQGIVWKHTPSKRLTRSSTIQIQGQVRRVLLLRDGKYLVCLHNDRITLWDTQGYYAKQLAQCEYHSDEKPLCLLILPTVNHSTNLIHLATINAAMSGIVWEVNLRAEHQGAGGPNGESQSVPLTEYCTFVLEGMDHVRSIIPVDSAGSTSTSSDFLDAFSHVSAMSYSATGTLCTYTARVNEAERSVDFLTTSTVETGLTEPALGSATSIRRAALVDSTRERLTIWDTRTGRLDLDETFNDSIHDLDWASTPDGQSILAVGFSRRVQVYSQLRYDYVNERPAWARIRDIHLPSFDPHPIGDSVWLSDGSLAIGAGNQLYLTTNTIDLRTDLAQELQSSVPHARASHIHDLVTRMNGPLPVFHPQFISQCVLADKLPIVQRVLLKLQQILKFYTEGDELDPMLGFEIDDFTTLNEGSMVRSYNDDDTTTVTPTVAASLIDLLSTKSIPQLSSPEQASLASIVDCIATVTQHARSMDGNASRFLLFWRSSQLDSHGVTSPAPISYREVIFAYHSTSQDLLIPQILSTSSTGDGSSSSGGGGNLSWPLARRSRLFTFLTSRATLLEQFESLARAAYTATDPRDPVGCSLHYLALRKKTVLVSLWRMATWSREQGATTRLLRNDFSEPRWRTAAAKNAFALMGKRRFEYAAGFFLLADDLRAALGVLANQLGDVELAIAVGRVYGGDEAVEVKDLVRRRVVGEAVRVGDRWMASWAWWFLGEKGKAVRALVSPLEELLTDDGIDAGSEGHNGTDDAGLGAKSFLRDDPALVIAYEQLRGRSLQTLEGALMVKPVEEWRFLVRTAGLLRRMGCDVLALDLVKNWEFLRAEAGRKDHDDDDDDGEEAVMELPRSPTTPRDPRKLLRRRSSLVVDDLEDTRPKAEKVASLLDSFGFDDSSQGSGKKVPSMLDGFGVVEEPKATTSRPPKVRSMLDDFGMDPDEASLTEAQAPQQTSVPSMLDAFEESKPRTSAPSMLDAFADPPKETSKGEGEGEDEKSNEKKKREPPAFKEPDANSILDSFGF